MKFTPLGGGKEIGANSYLIETKKNNILIDAGRHPTKDGYDSLPDVFEVENIDFIVISHSHYDHLSSLPYISKLWPKAKILMAKENKQLAMRILQNSVEVMKKQNVKEGSPVLYEHSDVNALKKKIVALDFFEKYPIDKDTDLTIYPAGHVMGSASVLIEHKGEKTFYTGDISLTRQLTISPAVLPDNVDFLISEGTYGSRDGVGPSRHEEEKRLIDQINSIIKKSGKVLLPVFALGRSQETLYMLLKNMEKGKIPEVPIYINGMVAVITRLYIQNYESINNEERNWFAQEYNLRVHTMPKNYSKILNENKPGIFVLSSGMLIEDTLSYDVSKELMEDSRNGIMFMGYQSPDSPGYGLLKSFEDGKIFDSNEGELNINCLVSSFNFSGHANYEELISIPRQLSPSKLIYVHGDEEALANLSEELKYEFDITIPGNLETVTL